jgi:hypothetical protein
MCVDCVLASPRIAQVDPSDEPLPEVVLSQVSGSLSMTDPSHGSVGSKGIVMLTSHWSMMWAVDSRQR